MDAYLKGQMSGDDRSRIEEHLVQCMDCAESYRLFRLANQVIEAEKEVTSNPFLVTRIMAGIENLDSPTVSVRTIPMYQRVLHSVIIPGSLAAAILIGVLIGHFYLPSGHSHQLPAELVYLDDASLESVDMFSME
jgi:anti-sigma factor RsiW